MINLVNTSLSVLARYPPSHVGQLTTPQGMRARHQIATSRAWALDNGCYTDYNPDAIMKMLHRFRGLPNCKFVTLPDVVRNHEETLILSMAWLGTYQAFGYPPAFVIQNGVTVDAVPYDSIAAIFIGGDNDFKRSKTVQDICKVAHQKGLWIHAGRVAGKTRLRYSRDILKAHSFDSSGFSKYHSMIDDFLPHHQLPRQPILKGFEAC